MTTKMKPLKTLNMYVKLYIKKKIKKISDRPTLLDNTLRYPKHTYIFFGLSSNNIIAIVNEFNLLIIHCGSV